jgi:hypothetical protein
MASEWNHLGVNYHNQWSFGTIHDIQHASSPGVVAKIACKLSPYAVKYVRIYGHLYNKALPQESFDSGAVYT